MFKMKTNLFLTLPLFTLILAACTPAALETSPAQMDATPVVREPAYLVIVPTNNQPESAPEVIAFEDLPALVMAASQPKTLEF